VEQMASVSTGTQVAELSGAIETLASKPDPNVLVLKENIEALTIEVHNLSTVTQTTDVNCQLKALLEQHTYDTEEITRLKTENTNLVATGKERDIRLTDLSKQLRESKVDKTTVDKLVKDLQKCIDGLSPQVTQVVELLQQQINSLMVQVKTLVVGGTDVTELKAMLEAEKAHICSKNEHIADLQAAVRRLETRIKYLLSKKAGSGDGDGPFVPSSFSWVGREVHSAYNDPNSWLRKSAGMSGAVGTPMRLLKYRDGIGYIGVTLTVTAQTITVDPDPPVLDGARTQQWELTRIQKYDVKGSVITLFIDNIPHTFHKVAPYR